MMDPLLQFLDTLLGSGRDKHNPERGRGVLLWLQEPQTVVESTVLEATCKLLTLRG